MPSKVYDTPLQIGAFLFDLIKNDDGTYTSIVAGEVHSDTLKIPSGLGIRFFTIPSSSDPDHPHIVSVHPNGIIRCDDKCQGFSYRHNCSHCDEVRKILVEEKNI